LNQPVILQLLEIPQAVGALDGVRMELEDSAFSLPKQYSSVNPNEGAIL